MASSTMMSASPTISYNWSPPTGLSTTVGQFVSASPTTQTNYTVTATNGGCIGTGTITITPLASPTINAAFTNSVICQGDPTTLNVSGATSYSVSPFAPIGTSFTPFTTTMYTIIGSNSFGCTDITNAFVIVNLGPSISVNANPPMACMGQSIALTFSGSVSSYSINGVTCGSSVAVTPTVQTTYTITGASSSGCNGYALITVYIGCLGVNNTVIPETPGLSVYPNPSAGQFYLSSGKDETISITNELGQLIRYLELKAEEKITIGNLSPGIYFVKGNETRIKIIVLE